MGRKEELAINLERVQRGIVKQARDVGREDVPALLPVTKFHPASDIALLGELGVIDVAENREQEARAKAEQLPHMRFHMIGQVQTKKANHVARWAHSVHSLDSAKLAHALSRGVELAQERGQREGDLPVFIQVSYDGDVSRGGIGLDDVPALAAKVGELPGLELAGLMVVPPLGEDPTEVFRAVRAATDELGQGLGRGLKMSAGMSADMAEAIACGSDIVRVGTHIMGPRPLA